MLTRHEESAGLVSAPVERVFAHVDDHARLSSHMSQSSWTMGGGRMDVVVDAGRGQCIGSLIRLDGTVFGVRLFVEEVVAEREPPYRKVWETVGVPRLLVIGSYRMGFELTPDAGGSRLRVFVDYVLPERGFARWLGRLFGRYYARWCTRRMVVDAVRQFASAVPADANCLTAATTARG